MFQSHASNLKVHSSKNPAGSRAWTCDQWITNPGFLPTYLSWPQLWCTKRWIESTDPNLPWLFCPPCSTSFMLSQRVFWQSRFSPGHSQHPLCQPASAYGFTKGCTIVSWDEWMTFFLVSFTMQSIMSDSQTLPLCKTWLGLTDPKLPSATYSVV